MNNDLISREALKKEIEQEHQRVLKINPICSSISLNMLNEIIDNAPNNEININDIQYAYDQGFKSGYELGKEERPHGKWLKSDIPESVLTKCSICGFDCGAYTYNYCPNCEAKMDGGKE